MGFSKYILVMEISGFSRAMKSTMHMAWSAENPRVPRSLYAVRNYRVTGNYSFFPYTIIFVTEHGLFGEYCLRRSYSHILGLSS